MTLQQGTRQVQERSSSRVTARFLNASRQLESPASARYRIDDVTNNRTTPILDWTTIVSPTATQVIVVTAEQNRILAESHPVETRVVTVEATGNDGLEVRRRIRYEIDNGPATD